MKGNAVLIEATCYDPVTASSKTLRFCNRNDPRVTTWNSFQWRPLLTKSPSVGLSVFNGDFTGFGTTTIDNFEVAGTDKDLDAMAAYMWHGATIKIYAGDPAAVPFNPALITTVVGNGMTRKSNDSLIVDLQTNDNLTNVQLLYLSYAGTGDAEGTADLEGILKPMCFGDAKYCKPVLIDEVRQIYQVHGYGPVEDIYGCFEGGLPIGTGGAAYNYYTGTYAAFRDAVVPQGEWIKHLNLGLIKLGSQPTFPVTVHCKGDTNGVAYPATCLKKAADIVKRMVTMTASGVSLSASSITALNTAAPYPIDLYYEDQVSTLEAVAFALRSVGAYWFWNSTGVMAFGRMRFGASSFTLSGLRDRLPDVMSISQLATSSPVWALRFGAQQCHFVHDGSDVPNVLVDIQDQLDLTGFVFPPGTVPPAGAVDGDQWPDTSTTPTTLRRYSTATSSWVAIASNGAQVNGGNVYDSGSGTPTTPLTRASLITLLGTAAAIVGQGNLALLNSLNPSLLNVPDASNMITDPDFNDTAYWNFAASAGWTTSTETLAINSSTGMGVTKAAKSPVGNGTTSQATPVLVLFTTMYPRIQPNKRYILAAKAAVKAGFTGQLRGLVRWFDANGVQIGSDNIVLSTNYRTTAAGADTVFDLLLETGVAPANADRCWVRFDISWSTTQNNAGYALVGRPRLVSVPTTGSNGDLRLEDGTIATDLLIRTLLGTAAGITGQGTLATLSSVAWATLITGRPANLAALAGAENLFNTGQPNLLLNGSLRMISLAGAPIGWSLGSNWSRNPGTGEGPFLISSAGGTNIATSEAILVAPTVNYTLQAELFAAGISSGSLQFDVQWYSDAAGTVNILDDGGLAATNGTGWTKYVKTNYVAPAGAASCRIRIFTSGAGAGTVAARRIKFSGGAAESPFSDEATNAVEMLTRPGTGIQVGDARNLTPIVVAGNRYYYNQNPTYTAPVAGTPATSTINLAAGTLTVGTATVSYNAMSVGVTGTNSTTVTYYLYIDDPTFAGGTKTLVATTSTSVPYQNDGRIFLGQVTITYPASGTGTGGGGTGGGGGGLTCVDANAFVHCQDGWKTADDVEVGDKILVLNEDRTGVEWETVTKSIQGRETCFTIYGIESGIEVTVSASTPITCRDGSLMKVEDVFMTELPFEADGLMWWELACIRPAGSRRVRKIYVNQKTYSAGDKPGKGILTHNPKP